jgi:hypothetical protein
MMSELSKQKIEFLQKNEAGVAIVSRETWSFAIKRSIGQSFPCFHVPVSRETRKGTMIFFRGIGHVAVNRRISSRPLEFLLQAYSHGTSTTAN